MCKISWISFHFFVISTWATLSSIIVLQAEENIDLEEPEAVCQDILVQVDWTQYFRMMIFENTLI